MNADEIRGAIESRQLTHPITTCTLRALVRQGRWADVGRMFDFEPTYSEIGGKLYFNWTCCPPAFWAAYQPNKYSGKEAPKKSVFRSARLATKPHPNERMKRFQDQEGICHYCRKLIEYSDWSIDHRTPLCRGGSKRANNKIGACKTCNHSKANLTEQEFRDTPPEQRKRLVMLRFQEMRDKVIPSAKSRR